MNFSEYIGSQFANPRGIVGKLCCICMNVANKKLYTKTAEAVSKKPHASILDIGCGNGYLEKRLCRQTAALIFGIDISRDMIANAAKRNKKAVQSGRVSFCEGDCCDLKFADETFEAVASVNTIYFWSDTAKGLSEIARVLKPGGVFVNAVYSKPFLEKLFYTKKGFKIFSESEYISYGMAAKFSDVTIEDIGGGACFIIRYIK